MKVFKRIKSKDNSKYIQKFLICMLVFVTLPNIFGMSYIYNLSRTTTDQSSISAVAPLAPTFAFQSKAQLLMEPSTGTVIYANNENEHIFPASVTKVMSLLLTMEAIDSGKLKYTDIITCSKTASGLGGSQIWFQPGEQLTVDEALKAICVVSANDVTTAVAEHLAGTEGNFVVQMNARAKELGIANTNFVNCHGLHDDNHYTTALDIAIMSRELITKHPDILKYTSIWMDTLRNGTFGLNSTNKLIRFYEGATGLKTGSTPQALFNLSGTATRDGTTFISVVCTAPSGDIRNEEVKQLLDYGFANYKTKNIFKKDVVLESIKINKNLAQKFDVTITEDVNVLYEKGREVEYNQTIVYNTDLKAPILKSTSIGKVTITSKTDNKLISEKDVVIKEDISKSKLMDYYIFLIKKVLVLG